MRPVRRLLVLAVALNLVLVAVYAWTASEETALSVVVSGDRVTARANGYETSAVDPEPLGDRIGLYLAGPSMRWAYDDAGPPPDSFLSPLGALTARLREEPLGTTWHRVALVAPGGQSRQLPAGDDATWQAAPGGGRAMILTSVAGDYALELELARGTTPAGVLVRASDPENGLLLLVRPEQRDLLWMRAIDGRWEGPIASASWSKTWQALLQDDLRVVLVTQQIALGIILAALFLAWCLGLSGARGEGKVVRSPRTPLIAGIASGLTRIMLVLTRPATMPLLLAVAAAGAAAYIAYFVLEAMPHVQDSVTYLFQARVFALGRLWVPASPIPGAFEQEFIVNFAGRAFGKYPPGHSLMLLPGVLAGAPWLINPLQAGLTVFVVYLLGREAFDRGTGLLAAVLVATSPFFLFMSGSFMAHPTGLLFTALFALLFVRLCRRQPARASGAGWRTALLAGLALGIVFVTRPYTALGIAVPFCLYAVYRIVRRPQDRLGDRPPLELRRFGPILLGLAPLVVGLVLYNYALTGLWLKNPMELWWPFDKVGFGAGIGISGEHTLAGGLWNTYRNLTELAKHLFGWPAYATLAFALVPFITLRGRRWDVLFGAATIALVVAHVAWWADGVMFGPRYYYELLAFLALLTARGVTILGRIALGVAGGKRAAAVLPYLLVGALIAFNVAYYLPRQWGLHHGYNYVNSGKLRAVQEAGIFNALVFVDLGDWYEWWNYGSVFPTNAPTLDGDIVYARDRGPALNRAVIDRFPGREYYRLSGTTLRSLAE